MLFFERGVIENHQVVLRGRAGLRGEQWGQLPLPPTAKGPQL